MFQFIAIKQSTVTAEVGFSAISLVRHAACYLGILSDQIRCEVHFWVI